MEVKLNINRTRLFKRAWYLFKQGYNGPFSYCLKRVWKEMKEALADRIRDIKYADYKEYQGSPWTPTVETMGAYYNSNSYKGD